MHGVDKDEDHCWSIRHGSSRPRGGRRWQPAPQAPALASSMIRRMVLAHRPHRALQPRQP